MNKEEKIYTFNEYVLGYDKGRNDRSCLTISKIQNGNMYVISSLYDGSAEIISTILDNFQQELDKYKNIVDEIKKDLYNILHNLEKYDETAGYVPEHLEYATNYTEQAIDKLKELKGSDR